MGIFDKVLLTTDYDRTLTDLNSVIPQRNLEAIQYFIDEGGAFTINTGRSVPMTAPWPKDLPLSAPLLLYNGAAAYDRSTGAFLFTHGIAAEQAELVTEIEAMLSDEILEIQGYDAHYTCHDQPAWMAFYHNIGCPADYCQPDSDLGKLLKLSILGPIQAPTVADLFRPDAEVIARYDRLEEQLRSRFSDVLSILRPAPCIIDMQAPGVSKGNAARQLQKQLGKSILICVGDERNDISMLDEADFAYCPRGSLLDGQYETVCHCDDGAVADVIYEKIPQILEHKS